MITSERKIICSSRYSQKSGFIVRMYFFYTPGVNIFILYSDFVNIIHAYSISDATRHEDILYGY